MKIILTLAAAAVALVATAQRPTHAGGARPWCELGAMTGNDFGNCNFATFAQCMATARGDGHCERNPRFDAYYFERGLPAPTDVDPYGRPLPRYKK
jgi:hypothetical protein